MARVYAKTAKVGKIRTKKPTLGHSKTHVLAPVGARPKKPSYGKSSPLAKFDPAEFSFGFADMGSPPLTGKFDAK